MALSTGWIGGLVLFRGLSRFNHRPETGAPLKLKYDGERQVSITDDRLREALNDYIENNRHDVTDDNEREPLLTTEHGRRSPGSIQHIIYKVTRPCFCGASCPHDRDPETCESTSYDTYSTCPSSISPHPLRRSSITHHLDNNVPKEISSERMSVSVDTLEEHYDARTKESKRRNREQYLGDL